MARVRLVGARSDLSAVLALLLDFGRLHLDDAPSAEGLLPSSLTTRESREVRQLRRIIDDADTAAALLEVGGPDAPPPPPPRSLTRSDLARWARRARRLRVDGERIRARQEDLEDERVVLQKHRAFLELFGPTLDRLVGARHVAVYGVTLPAVERRRLDQVAEAIRTRLGTEVAIVARPLSSGDLAVLLAVGAGARGRMEQALASAGVPEIPLPAAYEGQTLGEAAPRMLRRLAEIPAELAATRDRRAELARESAAELRLLRAAAHDRLRALEAREHASSTAHAFTLEGWLPESEVAPLRERLRDAFSNRIALEVLAREEWESRGAPVVLTNPRIFRPFEAITRMLPLPKYGTIDPTPFLAVTFPMLFGMMLGDVGYGMVLLVIAAILRWRATSGAVRTAAEIALPCAAFAIAFGVVYGELFGALGHQWLHMRPLLLDREHAVVAAGVAAVGVGLVHVVLGLALGIVSARAHPRAAASRGVQLVMLLLVVMIVLAAVKVLPGALFSPLAIAVFVGFPVLVVLEGMSAPIEFFSMLGNVLSYVRIMAIGTASVMLAVVANQMSGMVGSAVVGVLFGVLFHLVNFALGLFSPTVHALRLHYVEFFRQFYSGGGMRYEPFAHWRPTRSGAR